MTESGGKGILSPLKLGKVMRGMELGFARLRSCYGVAGFRFARNDTGLRSARNHKNFSSSLTLRFYPAAVRFRYSVADNRSRLPVRRSATHRETPPHGIPPAEFWI